MCGVCMPQHTCGDQKTTCRSHPSYFYVGPRNLGRILKHPFKHSSLSSICRDLLGKVQCGSVQVQTKGPAFTERFPVGQLAVSCSRTPVALFLAGCILSSLPPLLPRWLPHILCGAVPHILINKIMSQQESESQQTPASSRRWRH